MSEILPRVTGTEMEWPVLVQKSPKTNARQMENSCAEYMVKSVRSATGVYASSSGYMLSNGGRYYVDVGGYPEYATPEDVDFMGTVANEIAGEQIVFDTARYAQNAPDAPDGGYFNDFRLLKRVLDDSGKTCGYHINLAGDGERLAIGAGLIPLGAHLATINILTGAGAVIPREVNDGGSFYTVAQKSLKLSKDLSESSSGECNPLISIRREPHSKKNVRVHVTSLDANMSPWATWMKLGTTSLAVRMMEHGALDHNTYAFPEDKMFEVGKMVARDIDLEQHFEMTDGSKWSALDIQKDLVLRARKIADKGLVSNEELAVLNEWERALTDLQNNPEDLFDRVEWIAKRLVLEGYMARHALSMSSSQVYKKDLQWGYIADDGIGMRLRKKAWAKWMPPAEAIDRAYHSAPTTTRAMARAAIIREYASQNRDMRADWMSVVVKMPEKDNRYVMQDLGPCPPTFLEDYQEL